MLRTKQLAEVRRSTTVGLLVGSEWSQQKAIAVGNRQMFCFLIVRPPKERLYEMLLCFLSGLWSPRPRSGLPSQAYQRLDHWLT